MMTAQPGTYALVLASQKTGPVRIGRLGTLELQPGVYIYVGSAFGPGGFGSPDSAPYPDRRPPALAHRLSARRL